MANADSHCPHCEGINLGRVFLGTLLLAGGALWFLRAIGWIPAVPSALTPGFFWPLALIFLGLCFMRPSGFVGFLSAVVTALLAVVVMMFVFFGTAPAGLGLV